VSADSISKCAQCAEGTMREYIDYAIIKGILFVDYKAKCPECGFRFSHRFRTPAMGGSNPDLAQKAWDNMGAPETPGAERP
jgi:hypothetical protein